MDCIFDSFGVMYYGYVVYAETCKKNNKQPKGFWSFLLGKLD